MPDCTIRPPISGSKALYEAARKHAAAQGLPLSHYLDRLIRAELTAAGIAVPAPLPPKRNGPKPKKARRARAT